MYRLRLVQTRPIDPPSGAYDPWHKLLLVSPDGSEMALFENPLDGEELSMWFLSNMDSILQEEAPFRILGDDSIARSHKLAWDIVFDQIEKLTGSFEMFAACREILLGYNQRHNLRSGASGMEFPNIMFGIGANGPEVSCDDGGEWTWKYYPIDYREFYEWLPCKIAKGEYLRTRDAQK